MDWVTTRPAGFEGSARRAAQRLFGRRRPHCPSAVHVTAENRMQVGSFLFLITAPALTRNIRSTSWIV